MATFTRFSSDDIVITTEKVFTSTWSNNANALDEANGAATGSAQNFVAATATTESGLFFKEVFNGDASNAANEPQYAASYGHRRGSGSKLFTSDDDGFSATRSIYGQYRSLVFGDETRDFSFNGTTPDDIFIININRARYKQSLKPGSLNLILKNSSVTTQLTDDSITKSGSAILTNIGRQFNIVSGSSGVMSGSALSQTDSGSFGKFFPDAGLIVLNAGALRSQGCVGTITEGSDTNNDNISVLLDAIDLAGTDAFECDTEEKISSQFYFVRAKNKEFNYTTNPSFIDANGNLNFTSMVDNPVVYITTIGLYNDANELLAVAKLSQPVTKDFTKEALIKVKLDY
jgi:hypothetical protein